MQTETLPPDAHLFGSLRAVGYSLQTAIADIIDNSIAAGSGHVDVLFNGSADEPFIAIVDDGEGMDAAGARLAMQLAGTNSEDARATADLGRFGLGLKTASLSQCRRLTLITKRGEDYVALRWDLDYLAEAKSWSLMVLDLHEIRGLPGMNLLSSRVSGTLVLWQELDRLADQSSHLGSFIDKQMVDVVDHLSLVFHRFLSGDGVPKIQISVNLTNLIPADPFLSKSSRTQMSSVEDIELHGSKIQIQAYTLPFIKKMTATEHRQAVAPGAIRDSQGFYVYRGGRLVIWGTWFRLIPRADLSKLTRVKVDVPNTLDHLWSLDIKKSSAVPPEVVRERLRILASTLITPSERVHRFRGRVFPEVDSVVHPWDLVEDRDSVRYVLNRSHPSLEALAGELDGPQLAMLGDVLSMIEAAVPVQDIYNRMSTEKLNYPDENPAEAVDKWKDALSRLWSISSETEPAGAFLDRMLTVEPFVQLRNHRQDLLHFLTGSLKESGSIVD